MRGYTQAANPDGFWLAAGLLPARHYLRPECKRGRIKGSNTGIVDTKKKNRERERRKKGEKMVEQREGLSGSIGPRAIITAFNPVPFSPRSEFSRRLRSTNTSRIIRLDWGTVSVQKLSTGKIDRRGRKEGTRACTACIHMSIYIYI